MDLKPLWLTLSFLWFSEAPVSRAETNANGGPVGGLGGSILWGECNLWQEPSDRWPPGPVFCIRGKVGVEAVIGSGPQVEDRLGKYADGSLGVLFATWLSFHGRAREREFRGFGKEGNTDTYRDAEYAVFNLGNPVSHKVRLNVGQMRPPFGIDRPDVDEFYRLSEDRRFWPGPTSAVALILDDLRAAELDIGLGRYKGDLNPEHVLIKGDGHDVVTARLMRDFAGNGSTRLVLSGAFDSAGTRLYGAGFVNQAPNNDQLVFDVVRRLPQPDGGKFLDSSVTQIIRIGFTSHYERDTRWVFHFDDERDRFRRGLIELNYRILDHLIFRIGASYRINIEDRSNRDSRWNMISGFEGRL